MGSLVQGVEQGGCGFPDLADKYVTVVQAVLLYGLEKWMMTLRIGRVVACRMTEQQHWIGRYGELLYTLLTEAMTEARLKEVETYISCLQNKVAHFIATRPIMDLCLAAERRLGSRVKSGGGSRTAWI